MIDLGKAAEWNGFARKINALWNIRGAGSSTKIQMTESGGTIAMAAAASTETGLTDLDPDIGDFIHVGTGTFYGPEIFGNVFYGPQFIRNWNAAGQPYFVPDLVSGWNAWYPDGTHDFTWRLQLRLDFPFRINRLELYQVEQVGDGVPFWRSGQAWSTDNPIKPFQHQPGENPWVDVEGQFNVFPLKVFKGGSGYGVGVPMNTDYAQALSADEFAADTTHTFYMHGDSVDVIHISQFFRVMVFLEHADTGSIYNVVRGTIGAAPTDPPTENG